MKGTFFYTNDGVVASTDLEWLQSAFDTLTGMSDQVGLWTNVRKTIRVVCRPFWAAWVRSDEAYTYKMTGEGMSFKERQQEQLIYS